MDTAATPTSSALQTAALRWFDAGYAVVPSHPDRDKRPFGAWKDYQTQRPSREQVIEWMASGKYDGIGVLTGATSGRVEMLELEGIAVKAGAITDIKAVAEASGLGDLLDRALGGCVEMSPTAGLHMFIRVSDGPALGNTKLAYDDTAKKVLAETRGEGGFVIVAPTTGRKGHDLGANYVLINATQPEHTPDFTNVERDALHALLRFLDQSVAPVSTPTPTGKSMLHGSDSPVDDYNERGDWAELLTRHGWRHVYTATRGGLPNEAWRRPGKDIGISATTRDRHMYVFTTSTDLPADQPSTKFYVYARLEHHGDMRAATKALAASGYGAQAAPSRVSVNEPNTEQSAQSPPALISRTAWVPPLAVETAFFAATPTLTHVATFARARLISPWALLGATLARIIAATGPSLVLPSTVGSQGSLNTYVALVGPSGSGKSVTSSVARELLGYDEVESFGIGSGEGLIALYIEPQKQDGHVEWVQTRWRAIVTIDEIDTFAALSSRQGATIGPFLRSIWSGSAVGTHNADPSRRRHLSEHAYRLALIAGVQPGRAEALLGADATAAGTPQRFLWLPTIDPHMPDVEPPTPDPLDWRPPIAHGGTTTERMVEVQMPQHVVDYVRNNKRKQNKFAIDALDGHLVMCRLKAAVALSLLHGGGDIDDAMWELSGVLIDASNTVRDGIMAMRATERGDLNENKGRSDARRQIANDTELGDHLKKVALRYRGIIEAHDTAKYHEDKGGGCTKSCFARAAESSRKFQGDATELAIDLLWITNDQGRFKLGESKPR